jgi:hypothetical protein
VTNAHAEQDETPNPPAMRPSVRAAWISRARYASNYSARFMEASTLPTPVRGVSSLAPNCDGSRRG